MPKRKIPRTKLMVYMPTPLYKRLRVALAKLEGINRSKFICESVEKALSTNGSYATEGPN